MAYIIASIFIDVLNLILSSIVIYALRRLKKTVIISYWFVYCLNVSDFFVGTFGLVTHVIVMTHGRFQIWSFAFACFFVEFSFEMTFIIAIDRFVRMKYLTRYKSVLTWKRAYILALAAFISSVAVTFTLIEENAFSRIPSLTINTISFIVLPSICILYLCTYKAVKERVDASQLDSSRSRGGEAGYPSNCTKATANLERGKGDDVFNENHNEPLSIEIRCEEHCSNHGPVPPPSGVGFAATKNGTNIERIGSASEQKCQQLSGIEKRPKMEKPGRAIKEDVGNVKDSVELNEREAPRRKGNRRNGGGRWQARPERELFKYCCATICIVTVIWVPMNINNCYRIISGDKSKFMDALAMIMMFMASSLNSLVLIAFSTDLRAFIFDMVNNLKGPC